MKQTLLVFLALLPLCGQEGPYDTKLGTGTLELMGGVAYRNGDGRADQAFATRLSGSLNRFLALYGEYGYTRIISEETHTNVKSEARGSIMDYGGGVELHLSGYRVQPFVTAGIGQARISAKAAIGAFKATESEYHFASSFGGGLRFFFIPHIGISVEAKTVGINQGGSLATNGRFERYALGLFYQGKAGGN